MLLCSSGDGASGRKKVRLVTPGGRLDTLGPRSLFGFNLEVAGARPPAGLAGPRGKHRCLWPAPAESPTLARPRRCPWRSRLGTAGSCLCLTRGRWRRGTRLKPVPAGRGPAQRRRRKTERESGQARRRHGTGPGAPPPPPPALLLQPHSCSAAHGEGAVWRVGCWRTVPCHQPDGHHGPAGRAGQVRDQRAMPQAASLWSTLGVIWQDAGFVQLVLMLGFGMAWPGPAMCTLPPGQNVGRERPFG